MTLHLPLTLALFSEEKGGAAHRGAGEAASAAASRKNENQAISKSKISIALNSKKWRSGISTQAAYQRQRHKARLRTLRLPPPLRGRRMT